MSVRILIGDVHDKLAELPADHFDCVVTSPPYWGLRDYGVAGQLGLEPTLGEHLGVMVDVFEAVKRVLKPTGTLWINYGDCYATSPNGRSAAATKAAGKDDRTFRDKPFSTIGGTLKAKDLCMVPNRLAIALQEAGWWVRSEIIWAKPNPMPESIKDRPATAHEKIFMLSRAPRYHYDAEAVRQDGAPDTVDRYHRGRSDNHKWADGGPGGQTIASSFEKMAAKNPRPPRGRSTHGGHTLGDVLPAAERRDRQAEIAAASPGSSGRRMAGFNARWDASEKQRALTPRHEGHVNHAGIEETPRGSRSLRNYEPAPVQVWEFAIRPFSEAHFATFPPELAERCIKAGCPAGGHVLDPFGGAGTTGLVADRLGLNCTLIELNPEYAEIARKRIQGDAGLFSDVEAA